jgi:hypothetical protein
VEQALVGRNQGQGIGMSEPSLPRDPRDPEDNRRANLIMLLVALAVVVAGVWLVNKLIDLRRMQECAESGRHNCAPIDIENRRTW